MLLLDLTSFGNIPYIFFAVWSASVINPAQCKSQTIQGSATPSLNNQPFQPGRQTACTSFAHISFLVKWRFRLVPSNLLLLNGEFWNATFNEESNCLGVNPCLFYRNMQQFFPCFYSRIMIWFRKSVPWTSIPTKTYRNPLAAWLPKFLLRKSWQSIFVGRGKQVRLYFWATKAPCSHKNQQGRHIQKQVIALLVHG